jgi:N-acetylglucosamine kinase-like BadF-type ATPase
VEELLEVVSREQDDLPYIASEVLQVAEEGDPVARDIVRQAGRELGKNAALVARRLGMEDVPFELVLAGGLFQAETQLLVDPLFETVQEVARRARIVRLSTPPVVGAVALALERAGHEVDQLVMNRLIEGMSEPLRAVPMERI